MAELRQQAVQWVRSASVGEICASLGEQRLKDAAEMFVQQCEVALLLDVAARFSPNRKKAAGRRRKTVTATPSLPVQMWQCVFQFVQWDELLLEVRLVSHGFLHMVSDPRCWPWLRLEEADSNISYLFDLYTRCSGSMWSQLVGLVSVPGLRPPRPKADMTPALERCRQLAALRGCCLSSGTATLASALCVRGPNLRFLALPYLSFSDSTPTFASALASCCRLEGFEVGTQYFADVPFDACLEALAQGCGASGSLRVLELHGFLDFSEEVFVHQFVPHVPQLQCADFSRLPKLVR